MTNKFNGKYKGRQGDQIIKIISYVILSAFLFILVYIPNVPLKAFEAVGIFLLIVFIQSWYNKKYQFKLLSIDYRNQQTLLNDIFAYSPDLIFFKDEKFEYTACNSEFMKIMGKSSKDDVLGKTDFDLLSCDVAAEIRKHDEEVLKSKKTVKYIQRLPDENGVDRVYEVVKTPLTYQGVLGISRDITDMVDMQVELVEKQSQVTAILNNMPYIAYLKDVNGKFIVGNSRLSEQTWPVGDMVGKYPKDFLLKELADEVGKEDRIIIKEKKSLVIKKQIDTLEGKKWFDVHKAPIFDSENEVTGIVVIAKDIDAERNMENQRETFVATLTHDLKTPTTAQIRALKLVLDGLFGEVNPQQREILEQTLNSCKYMFNMISTILSTYKIGTTKINAQTYSLVELIVECCDELNYLAKERGHTIMFNDNMVSPSIYADKLEIKRVIINLIANAIAYAIPNSVVEINVRDTNEQVIFEIKNISHFIAQQELDELFEKYVSHATKFRQIGTGLGLYLSKQIILNHDGKMTATSSENNGNTFGFVIPRIYKDKELESVELEMLHT